MTETLEKKTFRELREAAGLNRPDMAELADCDPATISKLERGIMRATTPTRRRVCEVLGVAPEEITAPQLYKADDFLWEEDGFAEETPVRNLVTWRELRGMTMEELAVLADVHASVIYKIENGLLASIHGRTRRGLVRALRVHPAKLLLPGISAQTNENKTMENHLRAELRGARRVLRRWQDAARDGRYLTNRAQDDLASLIEDTERELRGT